MVARFGGTCTAYKNHKQVLENIQRDADSANTRFKKNPCRSRNARIFMGYNSDSTRVQRRKVLNVKVEMKLSKLSAC